MGITDSTIHSFSCPNCGVQEKIKVPEKGSAYGASWMDAPEAEHFTVAWKRAQLGEPHPVSIVCKSCGASANDSIS